MRAFVCHAERVPAAEAVPPSGVVTFLFTDIEGSTSRWEKDAGVMRAALAAHDVVLRSAVEGHRGVVFKHTGDGMCAAFASPTSAVQAAVSAQRELELPVRMGIATGEAELRDGDYFGTVLNRAARVMAAGHGGQILVAESTAALLSGVDLINLGPRRLRDLPTALVLFQVRADGLSTEFPPLRTLDAPAGNLRPAPTSFIGRDSEVAEVEALVRSHRLVTLTGPGGVGKTRLALEVANRLSDEFTDGVWFFELAAVSDLAAVPDAVAAVLGISQQPGMSVSDSVAAALEGRVRLLVFDNCEHVHAAAGDMVEAILAQSATVTILATSREGLGVADEHLWAVPPLDVGAGADSAAVTLFVERARTVAQRFSLSSPEQAAAVVDICEQVDGIPLAIELAASRMASMSPIEVRDRLSQRFRLLVGSGRAQERHQTLRHAVAWSYDHLGDAEKAVLNRCSVFAGGFDLLSACAVAGLEDEFAVLDVLDALVRKSLLIPDRSSGHTRFNMLETIRQFAEEQLRADADAAARTRATHARYYAGRETDVLALWDGPRQREAYEWLATEMPNLRNAFRWAADEGDVDTAGAIATYAGFMGLWVENYEPLAWAEEMIEPAAAVDSPRLATLYACASGCYTSGRVDAAVRYTDAARRTITTGRYDVPYGIHGYLGAAYIYSGHPERAVEWARSQLARDSDIQMLASTVLVLGMAGQQEEAMAAASGLIGKAEATGNPWVIANALLSYGLAFRDTEPAKALAALRRGLVVAQDSGNRYAESDLALSLCRLEARYGDPLAALDYFTVAIRNFHDSGASTSARSPLVPLSTFFDRLGRHEPAAVIAGFSYNPLAEWRAARIENTIAHLREILGVEAYEALAGRGNAMGTTAIVNYAYEQIEEVRAELAR